MNEAFSTESASQGRLARQQLNTSKVRLTLRLLGGLTTEEIARAFLIPEVAQRIVRSKRTLAEKRVPFEVPRGDGLAARLSSVPAVSYLIFNEDSAITGDDWMRLALCEEALRLGRILAQLAPPEPEVHWLVALMEIQCQPTLEMSPFRSASFSAKGSREPSVWPCLELFVANEMSGFS